MNTNIERKPLSINTVIIDNNTNQRYTVKSILGYGGTGITYKCISSDGNYYCLKEVYPTELADCLIREEHGKIVLNPIFGDKYSGTWNWYHENLINEEKTHRRVAIDLSAEANDPYFFKAFGTFTANGTLYAKYHMEKGCVLSQSIDSLNPSELLSVLITSAKKLDCLHNKKKLLHLDLSPSNLYVIDHARGKEAYFLDFGSALPLGDSDKPNHRFSATVGYSPQEILAKAEGNLSTIYKIGKYSDTYSLVAILFRALVGDIFSADYRIEPHLWMAKVRIKLCECGLERASDQLIEIIQKGLSERETRYQSANELFQDLCAVYNSITGNDTELLELISEIESRIDSFEKAISKQISTEADEIKNKTREENKTTRKHISKIAYGFLACFILLFGALMLFHFSDFEAPEITVQACKKSDLGYEIYGDYFECLLKITDNKELDWYYITEDDLIFDGFDCVSKLEDLNNGTYKLTLSNIKKTSDIAKIVIRAGCAEDASENALRETRIPLVFIDKKGDLTPPSVVVLKPSSASNTHMISTGENLTYMVSLSDETELSEENISTDYIHAVDFRYDALDISHEYGMYKITFINVQGNDGEHRVYFSPGLAIDAKHNYSQGIEETFYLYSDEKNIDLSNPEIKLSAPLASTGETEYRLDITDNMSIRSFDFSKKDITMVGFSADIEIEYVATTSNQHIVRIIRFKNIKSTSASDEKFFIINSGIETDSFKNQTSAVISPTFVLSE